MTVNATKRNEIVKEVSKRQDCLEVGGAIGTSCSPPRAPDVLATPLHRRTDSSDKRTIALDEGLSKFRCLI